jgi:hypothetical protein
MAIMSPSIRRSGRVDARSTTLDRQKIAFVHSAFAVAEALREAC